MSASAWGSHLLFIDIPFTLIPSCFETEVGAVAPSSGVADDMIDVIWVLPVWRYRFALHRSGGSNFWTAECSPPAGLSRFPWNCHELNPPVRWGRFHGAETQPCQQCQLSSQHRQASSQEDFLSFFLSNLGVFVDMLAISSAQQNLACHGKVQFIFHSA